MHTLARVYARIQYILLCIIQSVCIVDTIDLLNIMHTSYY